MSLPFTSDSIGNVLRLQGLKNVSGRRKVLPGAQFLQDIENVATDVNGTSNPAEKPVANMPELEMGSELTPQSYDVRANKVISEEAPSNEVEASDGESIWTRFGRALAMQSGHYARQNNIAPPIETQQVEAAEGLPPVNPEMQGQEPPESANSFLWSSVGNALKEYSQPFVSSDRKKEIENAQKSLHQDAQWQIKGLKPEEERLKEAQIQSNTQETLQDALDKAQQKPLEVAVYGATDEIAKNPALIKEFREITGLDFTPQVEEMTKAYEHVISDMENNLNEEGVGYSEQAQRIKNRILSNEATDMDKYYIGLALLMPLLIGGIFGKEAGLGALGGSTKGLAEVYGNRLNQNRKDEELLSDITKNQGLLDLKKGELAIEKMKIPDQIRKNLPADERAFLKGKREVLWKDPSTGEEKMGVEVKPGLVALPEFIANKEDLKEMKAAANEITDAKTATQLINSLTNDVIEISSKLKNKDALSQGFRTIILGKRPDLASKFSEQVEFEGRPVNAAIVLEHKLKLLTDAYRQAKGMRALTSTVQEHIDALFRNPATSFQNYEDTVDQMLYTRNLAQKNLIQNAVNRGFAPEFLEEEFGQKNKDVYSKLNKKEEEKMSSALLRE